MNSNETEPTTNEVRVRALAKVLAAPTQKELAELLATTDGRERYWVKHYAFNRVYGAGSE